MRKFGFRTISIWLAVGMCSGLVRAQQHPPADPAAASASQTVHSTPPKEQEKKIEKKEQAQRVLGVYPQFSVTSRDNAPPLTPGQKFRLFYKTAFDPFAFALAGLQAGMDQAENEYPAYGQGAKGYGKRYAADFGDGVSAGFWSNFVWPVVLRDDPRYFRLGEGTFKHRLAYSLEQEFVCRTDKGRRSFNFPNVLGALSAGALSNVYHPQADRGVGLTARGAAFALAFGSAGGIMSEFWPDIQRKIQKRRRKAEPPQDSAAPPPKNP